MLPVTAEYRLPDLRTLADAIMSVMQAASTAISKLEFLIGAEGVVDPTPYIDDAMKLANVELPNRIKDFETKLQAIATPYNDEQKKRVVEQYHTAAHELQEAVGELGHLFETGEPLGTATLTEIERKMGGAAGSFRDFEHTVSAWIRNIELSRPVEFGLKEYTPLRKKVEEDEDDASAEDLAKLKEKKQKELQQIAKRKGIQSKDWKDKLKEIRELMDKEESMGEKKKTKKTKELKPGEWEDVEKVDDFSEDEIDELVKASKGKKFNLFLDERTDYGIIMASALVVSWSEGKLTWTMAKDRGIAMRPWDVRLEYKLDDGSVSKGGKKAFILVKNIPAIGVRAANFSNALKKAKKAMMELGHATDKRLSRTALIAKHWIILQEKAVRGPGKYKHHFYFLLWPKKYAIQPQARFMPYEWEFNTKAIENTLNAMDEMAEQERETEKKERKVKERLTGKPPARRPGPFSSPTKKTKKMKVLKTRY